MASGAPIRAGRAFVELATKDSALNKGLNRAKKRLAAFAATAGQAGRSMIVAAAAIAAPMLAGSTAFGAYEEQLAEVSTMLQEPARYMADFDAGAGDLAFAQGVD